VRERYVTYHVIPVSSTVNGIAAQAIYISHTLNTWTTLRGGIGFNGASADAVSSSVHALVGKDGTVVWARYPPNTVALLDPITGLAARLVHVRRFPFTCPDEASYNAAPSAVGAPMLFSPPVSLPFAAASPEPAPVSTFGAPVSGCA